MNSLGNADGNSNANDIEIQRENLCAIGNAIITFDAIIVLG